MFDELNNEELLNDMINFLNDRGMYYNFIEYAEGLGYDRDQLEEDIEKIQGF